jgi:hypothetical protein
MKDIKRYKEIYTLDKMVEKITELPSEILVLILFRISHKTLEYLCASNEIVNNVVKYTNICILATTTEEKAKEKTKWQELGYYDLKFYHGPKELFFAVRNKKFSYYG